jgi:multidrug resistance efflux pump
MSLPQPTHTQSPADPNSEADPALAEAPATDNDAVGRLKRLDEELRSRLLRHPADAPAETPPPVTPDETPVVEPRKPGFMGKLKSLKGRQGAKSLIAIAVALALGWIPLQRLLATTSAEATVNARLINLRAPIDGTVTIVAPTLAIGSEVEPSETLLNLTNPRADRGRLDDLRRTINGLTSDMHASSERVAQLKGIEANLLAQRNAFQEGRIRQLEARAAELTVQITTAQAMHADAKEAVERSTKLKQSGSQTVATLLHAERDFKTTQLSIEAARIRLEGNKIELDAAKKGLFVGDSYNDLPRSAQRLDEVRQQILDGSARVEENKGRLGYLEKELAAETEQFATHSHADVNATVRGRIWEVLTANGEEVRVGQDLLRVLDCAGAVVTATVSESVYNKLWIGQQAHFRLRGERQEYPSTVVGLTGLAAAGSNFAIGQTTLTREPYHVTIAVPGLAARRECNVGRTGQVTFDTSAAAAADETVKTAEATKPSVPE